MTGKNYIGNQLSAKGNKTYKTFNPEINQENDVEFCEASSEEINDAVTLASRAFKKFRTTSGAKKSRISKYDCRRNFSVR
jgi:NADP-dependent aldehyde dehydrogenase